MDRRRLAANVDAVRERIRRACDRAGRAHDVTLVAITKYVPPDAIEALGSCGIADCGENRVLEGLERAAAVRHPFRWHFVGHLQTNKVRRALERFEVIHSIDRWDVAAELQKHLDRLNKSVSGFVQINVSGEKSKAGVPPGEAASLVGRIRAECPRIELLGLMTMAPHEGDPELARPHFRRLRELRDAAGLGGLSMGMTADFEVAIEEGATHVRIGSALFEGIAAT